MKIIPMSAEASYRKAVERAQETYMFKEQSEEVQRLLRKVFRAGWIASKENTFEILEAITIGNEDDNGTRQ